MSRGVVSEFQLKGLDRAAKFAGEVFGSDDAAGRDCPDAASDKASATLWVTGAVFALCAAFFLFR